MKRITITIFLLLFSIGLKAQLNTQLLYNTWIKVKVTYNNNKPLVYANTFKYSYAKYIFRSDGKAAIKPHYSSDLLNDTFLINDSAIIVDAASGFQLNKFKIAKLSADSLILIGDNGSGLDSANAWKIYLIPQTVFQQTHKFQPDEYNITAKGDTIYNESPFVHPDFMGGEDFSIYIQNQISNTVFMNQQQGHFLATLIVNKAGGVDSLKIVNGINTDFDKAFMKSFAKCQAFWKPAILLGKAVNTKVTVKYNYWGADVMEPGMRLNENADDALNEGKFEIALHYYEESLTYLPDDISNIYKAALCKLALGRTDGVCEALAKVNHSGTMIVDELIGLVCNNKN